MTVKNVMQVEWKLFLELHKKNRIFILVKSKLGQQIRRFFGDFIELEKWTERTPVSVLLSDIKRER